MAHDSLGARNQPHYSGAGAPSDAADLTEVSDFAAAMGNRMVDLSSVRTGLTVVWEGLEFYETDTKLTYLYTAGAWVVWTARIGGSVRRNNAAATFTASAWTQLTNSTYWATDQPAAGGMAAFSGTGTWVAPISGVYDVRIGIQLDTAVSAILALKKNDSGASRTGAIASESVTGTASFTGLSVSKMIRLNANDYVAAAIFNSATAVWNTDSPDSSYFSIRYVEPLR